MDGNKAFWVLTIGIWIVRKMSWFSRNSSFFGCRLGRSVIDYEIWYRNVVLRVISGLNSRVCPFLRHSLQNVVHLTNLLDPRRAVFRIGDTLHSAKLVDLPCIIESQKTLDNKHMFKVADICQVRFKYSKRIRY